MQHVRIRLFAEDAVRIEYNGLFTDVRRDIQAPFHSPHRFWGINNVGRESFTQQRGFAAPGRADNHIPWQLPQVTAAVEMALQAQQPAVEVALLGVQFDTEWIKRLFALLFLLPLKLL